MKNKIKMNFLSLIALFCITISAYAFAAEDLEQIAQSNAPDSSYDQWDYEKLDLDATGNLDYLFIVYGSDGHAKTIIILKYENNAYSKIWELPEDPYREFGITPVRIEVDDLDGDGKPEILISAASGAKTYTATTIVKWQNEATYIIEGILDGSFVDLDRDGVKEMVGSPHSVEDVDLPDGTTERRYHYTYFISKLDGSSGGTIDLPGDQSFFLSASLDATPQQWHLSWVNATQPERIKTTLSAIEESHPVSELNPASVRLEDRVMPMSTYIEDGKFVALFDKQEVMTYLLKAPRLTPLAPGDKIGITISALLPSGQYVSGSSEIEIVEEPKSIPFSQFDLKHWRIHWDQGKHDKNKFQLSGRIDLPDHYTLDSLQKKGVVTITIEKKNSMPFSQNATLGFKQKGPIWYYKAQKIQNDTQKLLAIEEMLIFWQPEATQDKPDKAGKCHHKRTGWFMIQGTINIPAADQAALLPKASLTLNIPIAASGIAGSIESTDNIAFIIKKNLWLFQSPRSCPGWKNNWWEDIKD